MLFTIKSFLCQKLSQFGFFLDDNKGFNKADDLLSFFLVSLNLVFSKLQQLLAGFTNQFSFNEVSKLGASFLVELELVEFPF